MENKNQELLNELKEMHDQVKNKPDGPIKERLLKALDKKIKQFETQEIETK